MASLSREGTEPVVREVFMMLVTGEGCNRNEVL